MYELVLHGQKILLLGTWDGGAYLIERTKADTENECKHDKEHFYALRVFDRWRFFNSFLLAGSTSAFVELCIFRAMIVRGCHDVRLVGAGASILVVRYNVVSSFSGDLKLAVL